MKRLPVRPPWLMRLHERQRVRAYLRWERDLHAFLAEKARAKRARYMADVVPYTGEQYP